MESQYYTTISLEDLKRLYPNVQVLSVGSGVSDDSQTTQQQVILAPDESLILNEASIQQLVAYQQPSQNTQAYVIQSADNETGQQAPVAQSSIYYSTEVSNEQLIQHQQPAHQHISIAHQVHQDNSQQNILQKAIGTGQQQTLIQQPISNQTTTQHVLMQQTPHIVLQQQNTAQHQQTSNQIVLRQMPTSNSINQPRYVYQQARTVVYNTQPQATLQSNHQQSHMEQSQQQQHRIQQQVESPTNSVAVMQQTQQTQQPTTQLIVTGQPQLQTSLVYQTSQAAHHHTQQQQIQQHQQAQQPAMGQQKRIPENTLINSRIARAPRLVSPINQSQTPRLAPLRNGPRFSSPTQTAAQNAATQASATSMANAEVLTPPQTAIVKQTNRRTNSGRGRSNATPRNPRVSNIRANTPSGQGLGQQQSPIQQTSQQSTQLHTQQQQTPQQIRTIQYTSNQTTNQGQQQQTHMVARQTIPPLVSTPNATQRIFSAVISGTSAATVKTVGSGAQMTQRSIAAQASKIQGNSAGTLSNQAGQMMTPKYRIPKNTPTLASSANANTNTNGNQAVVENADTNLNLPLDLEESIQAVVVTKANDQATPTAPSNEAATQKPFQTTVTTYSTIESAEDDKKSAKVNGRVISLSELKRQQRQQSQQSQMQTLNKQAPGNRPQPSALGRIGVGQTSAVVRNANQQSGAANDDTKKVIRSQPQNQHIIQPISSNKLQNPSGDTQKSARMLVILSNGEQRLITFTLPRESCTVQELLEQVGVPFTPKTSIQCVPNPGASIDYIVTVGITVQESPTELATAAENSLQLSKQQQQQQQETADIQSNVEQNNTTNEKQSPQPSETSKEIPAKIIPGFLAVCIVCGYTGGDFAKCERCKRVFPEEPKRIAQAKISIKSDDEKKKAHGSDLLSRAANKASLIASAPTLSQLRAGKMLVAAATGRGRGRALPRVKPAEVEPVILTLSSDDEGDDEKSNKSMKTQIAASSPPLHKPPLSCEPIIMENMSAPANMEREDVANVTNSTDQLYTSFTCKTIRFGTFKYEPKEKVLISSKGIKIVAPSCKNPSDAVVLNIQMREVVKIVAHFSKSLNILFIYTLPGCGIYIRENLEMKTKSPDSPYYNPTDRAEPYKRIVLQMDAIQEETKSVIRSIYSKATLEEIQYSEANELLARSCLKDKYIKQDQGSTAKSESENIRQILIYPPGKGGIPINTEDYMCLAIDQYLNDVIIDFYLKYLHTNVLSEEQKQKTHIFSSFFYNRLTTMTTRQRHNEKDVKLTASQKRHARVKSWTKNVNLFEKEFIIIPINEQSHWFLAIICFPELKGPVTYDTNEPVANQPTVKKKKPVADRKVSLQIGNTTITPVSKRELDAVCLADDSLSERDEAEGDESDLASDESDSETQNGNSSTVSNPDEIKYRPIKQPLILIFDSLAGASRSRVVATLRDYLTCEYRAKIKQDSAHTFNKFNMPGHCVKVPQQNNFTDCGLYVLQYVEQFFKDPIKDYKLPIKQLVNWFETIIVTRKREEISNLLKELIEKHNPDKLPLPEISFPTLNGKLLEQELTDEQAEFEEEEMGEEGEEEDEEEVDSLADGETEGENSPVKRNGEKRTISITPSSTTITLKRPLDTELSKSLDPVVRKTVRLNESI